MTSNTLWPPPMLEQPPTARPLFWLSAAAAVEARLRASAFLPLRDVRCEYCDGQFVLRGSVPTFYCKQMAQSVALATPGVDRLANQIEVSTIARRRAH